jgi:hypothetical protein
LTDESEKISVDEMPIIFSRYGNKIEPFAGILIKGKDG